MDVIIFIVTIIILAIYHRTSTISYLKIMANSMMAQINKEIELLLIDGGFNCTIYYPFFKKPIVVFTYEDDISRHSENKEFTQQDYTLDKFNLIIIMPKENRQEQRREILNNFLSNLKK